MIERLGEDDLAVFKGEIKEAAAQAAALSTACNTAFDTASSNKVAYAQYFTPQTVADFMSDMFERSLGSSALVLDPGAGEGILGLTLARRLHDNGILATTTLIEIDERVFRALRKNAGKSSFDADINLINGDFLKVAFELMHQGKRFTHVIMNPPYFKLQRGSNASDYLLSGGVNVTNIYAAFMWLGLLLLEDGGQLVAIVPRSFCNGPYFIKLRQFIAENVSIEAIHTFATRDKVFSKDQVLQENVIIRFAKKQQSSSVKVTYSSDQGFFDVQQLEFQIDEVLKRDDPSLTIFIPAYAPVARLSDHARCTLAGVGLEVSTGPVVDFRLGDSISKDGSLASVPLLYPAHMKDGQIVWPLHNLTKKGQYYRPQPNLLDGIDPSFQRDKNVSPADGFYVVVRRFSSKEEKRRIYAAVVDSSHFAGGVAFENHLNYFHIKKHGFDEALAYGLSAYLNSSLLDDHFRTFSGHTQVNATDLRNIPYPSEKQLRRIGRIALGAGLPIELVATPDLIKECL